MAGSLLARVLATPIRFKAVPYTVDWGRTRGQGKRIGYMIVGAMSDNVRGVRRYADIFGELPDIDEVRDEVDGLRDRERIVYLKARSLDLDHETAMRVVMEDGGELKPGATEAYLLSKGA